MFCQSFLGENTRTDPPLLEVRLQGATQSSLHQGLPPPPCSPSHALTHTIQTQNQPPKRLWNKACRVPSRPDLTDRDPEDAFESKGGSASLVLLNINSSLMSKDGLEKAEEEGSNSGDYDDNPSHSYFLSDPHSQEESSSQRLLNRIEVGSCYVPVVQNTVRVTCETCWRQFILTPKDPCRLERHQQKFCRTSTQRRVQRWWSEIEAFADGLQHCVTLAHRHLPLGKKWNDGKEEDEEEEEEEEDQAKCGRRETVLGNGQGRTLGCGYYAGKKIWKKNRETMKREAEAFEKKEWKSTEIGDQDE